MRTDDIELRVSAKEPSDDEVLVRCKRQHLNPVSESKKEVVDQNIVSWNRIVSAS